MVAIAPKEIMAPAEKVYELIKDMPPNQISEVLNFAEFLKQKSERKKESQPIPRIS